MVKRFSRFLKNYSITPLLVFTVAASLCYLPLKDLLFKFLEVTPRHSLSQLLSLVFFSLYVFLWVYVVFITLRSKRYKVLTGRNFAADSSKYHRTYYELVQYFSDSEPHKLDLSDCKEGYWRKQHGLVVGAVEDPKEIKKLKKQNASITQKKKEKKKEKEEKKQKKTKPKKLPLITLPSDTETNIAVFGPPGSYKTSGLAIINAITFEGSVLAVDCKSDIYNSAKDYRHIVRFCPDSPDPIKESVRFNPLQGINEMSITEKKLYLDSMSSVLIKDKGGSDGNYFTSRARKLFQGISHLLLFENKDVSFPDIVHAILAGNPFDWVKKALESECTEAKELLASFYGCSEKNISGAYDECCDSLRIYSNPILDVLLNNKGDSVSIETLEQGTDIYLQVTQKNLKTYAPLFTLFLQTFSLAFTSRPDSSSGKKNRPILMLLDEFPELTFPYETINSNLATLRSKSVLCMLIQQNYSQLQQKYGVEGTNALIGNCNMQIILGSNDVTSSKMFSDLCGTKKVLKVSNSESKSKNDSHGISVQEAREPVFYPEDFGDLPSTNSMVFYYKGKYCRVRKLNCYKD